MDVWPAQLQQKLNTDSFEVKMGTTSVRTDMDVGPAKVRSRFTDAIDVYNCTIYLDFDDYDTFTQFYKLTLNNGVNPFEFVDPFTEIPETFRFVSSPSIRPLGGRIYQVGMVLEKLTTT